LGRIFELFSAKGLYRWGYNAKNLRGVLQTLILLEWESKFNVIFSSVRAFFLNYERRYGRAEFVGFILVLVFKAFL